MTSGDIILTETKPMMKPCGGMKTSMAMIIKPKFGHDMVLVGLDLMTTKLMTTPMRACGRAPHIGLRHFNEV